MDCCDVLIVGGGPAGSSCAWKLRHSGLDVVILDREVFPRNKVCGGWITPAILTELEIDAVEYAHGRVFQPITGFRTGCIGRRAMETGYGEPISYGILRREFDDYLLKRSGARLIQGVSLTSLERSGGGWIANGCIKSRLVVGAGGHFCPVARLTGAKAGVERVVVAQEAEFEMDAAQIAGCRVRGDVPELYFCPDMKGYGWCFRKENYLNVGLGRMDPHRLSEHVAHFLGFLKAEARISCASLQSRLGHAYLLYGASKRNIAGDGFLLIGDAAGLAYSQSGEGIRPAIESGLMAGEVIRAGDIGRYRALIARRYGEPRKDWAVSIGRHLPPQLIGAIARRLLCARWFVRDVVIDRWFLHSNEPLIPKLA